MKNDFTPQEIAEMHDRNENSAERLRISRKYSFITRSKRSWMTSQRVVITLLGLTASS